MSKPLSRAAALVAAAAVAVALSACTASAWVPDAPPAAGVQTDVGGIKLRNVMVVSDEQGAAVVAGGISSRDTDNAVTGITVAAEKADATFSQPQNVAFTADIPKGRTVTLDWSQTAFTDPALRLGKLAEVAVTFSDGTTASVKAPIYSATHPDFKDAYAAATAGA